MLSYDQARDGDEFHIAHDNLRCTILRKSGSEFYPTSDGGWMMLVTDPRTGEPGHLTDADADADSYHVPADCPHLA